VDEALGLDLLLAQGCCLSWQDFYGLYPYCRDACGLVDEDFGVDEGGDLQEDDGIVVSGNLPHQGGVLFV
jgi:hypothetical protein